MRISEEEITAVRSHADIVDIIGRYIPLVKKGRSMSAVCPFHDDHDPSLSISQDKQIYKCFVCNNGGNVFTFVQNYENCGFIESVVKVAEMVSYPLSISADQWMPKKDERKEGLYKCLDEAIHYMRFQLFAQEGKIPLAYLNKRGLDKSIIEQFGIGYNGPSNQVTKFLSAKGYAESDMLACNLARLTDQGIGDVFFNRITFPIHDSLGNPVAFTARAIDPDIPSKYINSNETELYIKGNIVYNYHRAKSFCKKENRVIVTEGVMDVIAFARAGIFNVVATLGTSCTKEQIRLLKQCSNHVTFCYDGDRAGRSATLKAAKIALQAGCDVYVIQNRTGLDPDEIIERYGLDELQEMSCQEQVWMEYFFNETQTQYNLDNYSEKKQFAFVVKAEIDQLKDDFDRQSFLHRLTSLTGFTANQLGASHSVQNKLQPHRKQVRINPLQNGKTNAEYHILSQMLISQEASELFKAELGFLGGEETQRCAMIILDYYRKYDQMNVASLLDTCTTELQKQLILELSSHEMYLKEYNKDALCGSINRFKRAMLEEKLSELQAEIQKITNPESKVALIQEKIQLQRELGDSKHEK